MEILAIKVMKSLINKLNSIVLYSSEEQVCLTSSVSKCVHQSWYYQLSILISAHLCPILWSMTNCWMLNCLNCLMSFQVLSVSNRSPIGYSSVSALFYLPNFQMSPTVQLFICPCVFNSLRVSQLIVPTLQGIQLIRYIVCHRIVAIGTANIV